MNCGRCGKPERLCVCDAIIPVKTRTQVLILQHPQEPREELGTAQIAHLALPNSVLRVALSCRNLEHALKQPAENKDWGVLYLGSAKLQVPQDQIITFVDRKGQALKERPALKGLVVLDGTWSQAKALWWRNAWLLKLKRIVLSPPRASLYGSLRKEPRRDSLSTIESIAYAVSELEQNPEIREKLMGPFKELLAKARERRAAS